MIKNILKLEELAMFTGAVVALYLLKADWWFYLLMLLGPDVSMLGYLVNKRVGAFSYNLFHHKGTAVLLFVAGLLTQGWLLQAAGIILLGHSSFDRMFGYGLKYFQGFHYTHLGIIGNKTD